MFSILISEKGGEQKRLDFDRPEITIGRVQGNDIVLPKGNVSKRHSRIVFKDGKFIIVDLKSTNGTYVNGRKITAPLVVKGTDKIYIGDFIMTLEEGSGPSTSSTSDVEGAGRGAPPPPPPRGGGRPGLATMPALRAEPTSMDMPAGIDDGDDDVAAGSEDDDSSKSPIHQPAPTPAPIPAATPERQSRPPLPPLAPPRPLTRPPLQTLQNETLRPALGGDALAGMSPLDRPIVAGDRLSDKATMMAGDAPPPRSAQPASAPPSSAPPAPAPTSAPPPAAPPAPAPPAPAAAAPAPAPAPPAAAPSGAPGLGARPSLNRPTGGALPSLSATKPLSGGPARPAAAPVRATLGSVSASSEDPQRRRHIDVLNQVISKAVDPLGLRDAAPEQLTEAATKLEKALHDAADKVFPLPIGLESEALAKQAVADVLGAGPLDDLLADETIHEIAVASHDRIFVDRGTGQSLSERVFSSPAAVARAIHRLVSRAGGRLDSSLLEVRLDNGALLQAALPPHARVPSLVLRRVRKAGGRLQDLVNQGVLSAAMSEFLEVCMRERRNLLVSGYGRGVMLGALGGATSAGARVVTVEPVGELDLSATHAAWIGLIARGLETRAVIGHAGRMHPDHLIITDVRGPEALDVAAALCGGQGVVVGVDAASAREAVSRLESLGRLSNESPVRQALREELASGINLAVHVGRTAAGAYRVMEISEVTLGDDGNIEMMAVFTFKPEGGDGQFVATGHVPAFAG